MQILPSSVVLVVLLSASSLVSAHYRIIYPYWRGDSYATQWTYPCGGVDQSISDTNRTAWPLEGGALVFTPTHTSAQTYVNIGLGNNVTALSIAIVEPFNQTGNGTFCFQKIPLPPGLNITEGSNATLQVIQLSHTGGALYNCADITFKKDARVPDGICVNSTGVGEAPFYNEDTPTVTVTAGAATATNNTGSGGAVAGRRSDLALLGSVSMIVGAFLLW